MIRFQMYKILREALAAVNALNNQVALCQSQVSRLIDRNCCGCVGILITGQSIDNNKTIIVNVQEFQFQFQI